MRETIEPGRGRKDERMVTIRSIGNTGGAFRIYKDGRTFDVRSRSPRAFYVVGPAGYVLKRTDNLETARRVVRDCPGSLIIDRAYVNREGEVTR